MFLGKPWEYWATFAGAAIYVAMRDAEREPLRKRFFKTVASAALAFGLSPSLAEYVWGNETAAALLVMVFVLLLLDQVTALVSDLEFIKDLIRRKGGVDNGDGGDEKF